VQADESNCDDFLALNNNKSSHLNFHSCEKGKVAQLRVLIATYIAEGKYAEKVE